VTFDLPQGPHRVVASTRPDGSRAQLGAAGALVLLAAAASACAFGHSVASYASYGHPRQLVGTWVDSSLATPTDTVAWVLGAHGLDETLTIHVARDSTGAVTRQEHREGYGYWYAPGSGVAADSGRICFRSRARGHDVCYPYHVTVVSVAGRERRRLKVDGYQGRQHTRDRILIAR